MKNKILLSKYIIILCLNSLSASGGFDIGTSTGKGKLQLDFTLNPFNFFENGQNYIVFGYGMTDKIDIHGYFSNHSNYKNGVSSYYYGIFYQFLNSKYVDLSTAIGKRNMLDLTYNHIFFPQLLYNIKLNNNFSVGGSFVRVTVESLPLLKRSSKDWFVNDIAFFIPLKRLTNKYKKIEDIKLGIGLFKTGIGKNKETSPLMPTYSIDIKFKKNFHK